MELMVLLVGSMAMMVTSLFFQRMTYKRVQSSLSR